MMGPKIKPTNGLITKNFRQTAATVRKGIASRRARKMKGKVTVPTVSIQQKEEPTS